MTQKKIAPCGERIQEALRIRGMKQADLCKLTNIPKSALSQYISGQYEPKQNRIYVLSQVLNVTEAWLMGYDIPMERQKTPTNDEQPLTEGESLLLKLFRKVPLDKQELVLDMIRVALKTQE